MDKFIGAALLVLGLLISGTIVLTILVWAILLFGSNG